MARVGDVKESRSSILRICMGYGGEVLIGAVGTGALDDDTWWLRANARVVGDGGNGQNGVVLSTGFLGWWESMSR